MLAAPEAGRRRVYVYGVGGGGDIGVVCAFIHGRTRAGAEHPDSSYIGVGAGYSLSQYRRALEPKIPGREDDWLQILFSNVCEGDNDPHFFLVSSPFDRAAVDAIWGPGVDSRPSGYKYCTGIDELFIRSAMGVTCELALLYSVSFGKKYLSFRGEPVDTEVLFRSEQDLSLEGVRHFLGRGSGAEAEAEAEAGAGAEAGPGDEHVLFDVGGDIVDFESRGRDSNLLLTLLRHFASLGALSPRVSVVILGLGCDAHAFPATVKDRLVALGFAEVPEGSADWSAYVSPLLHGLESNRAVLSQLQLLDSHKRATQLFLDARAQAGEYFSFTEDERARDNSFFGRGEVSVRSSSAARGGGGVGSADSTRTLQAQWRALLGEPGSPEMLAALGVMRQVWMLSIPPGAAERVYASLVASTGQTG